MLTGCTCRVYFPWLRAILSPAIYLWDSFTPLKGQPCFFFFKLLFLCFFYGLGCLRICWVTLLEIILYSALLHILQLCTQPTWVVKSLSSPGGTGRPGLKPGLCHQSQAGAVSQGCEHACRLPFLRHSGVCSMGSVTGLAEVPVSSLPHLVRAPSAPRRQDRLHLLLVILSWCTLGNLLRPLTFFVCACFLGRKSLSEVNILCEMWNNHENCWALVLNFSSWRLCRI